MEKIVILGKGGHAASLVDILERQGRYDIAGYVVNDEQDTTTGKYPVIGNDECLEEIYRSGIENAAVGIGYMGKSNLRQELRDKLKKIGYMLPVICDPTAILAQNVGIGEGTFIGKGAIINANALIGSMCIINTGAIIEHDCRVGDFSHISVGSVMCGGVQVGCSSFVGANATVIQECTIGNNCIVGAGVTIRKNVEDDHIVCNRETNIQMRRS